MFDLLIHFSLTVLELLVCEELDTTFMKEKSVFSNILLNQKFGNIDLSTIMVYSV